MTAKDLTAALRGLTEGAAEQTSRQDKTLPSGRQAPAIPPRSGLSGPVAKKAGGTGSIASPLTETSYAARTFHPETTITSVDGLFAIKLKPVKDVLFLDAAATPVTINFGAPT